MPTERALPLTVDGNELNAGIAIPSSSRAAVLLLHGIPSTAAPAPDDTGYPGLARDFAERGFLAGWVDMRAVRGSQGYFSLEGWVRDATAALEALRALEEARGISAALIGSSAGGVVAAEVARRGAGPDAVALLAAPAEWVSFSDDATAGVRRIKVGADMAVGPEVEADPSEWGAEFERIRAVDAVGSIDVPLLLIHGTADDVVPVEHAELLRANAPRAEVHILEGVSHHLRREPRAIELVLDWLARTF